MITDEQCLEAFRSGVVDETTYVTAIGACGAETEDEDGDLVDPDENEIERARERITIALGQRASKETP